MAAAAMIMAAVMAAIRITGLFFRYDVFFHVFGSGDTFVGAWGLAIGFLQKGHSAAHSKTSFPQCTHLMLAIKALLFGIMR
jgi:hypothetical protein